jgi:hypothetical protein
VRVLRATVAVSLAVALQLAALGAPLLHAHRHDGHHGRHGAYVHAHVGGHTRADPGAHHDDPLALDDVDRDRATWLQLFVAVKSVPFSIPALPHPRYAVPAPLESIMRKPPAVVHSHDPPGGRPAALRGPPAIPS